MTAPLTPESEQETRWARQDIRAALMREHHLERPSDADVWIEAIEAAAIARYAEGLVDGLALAFLDYADGRTSIESAHRHARIFLAIPEAQEAEWRDAKPLPLPLPRKVCARDGCEHSVGPGDVCRGDCPCNRAAR
jgi:hypothetical protein